MPDGGYDVGFAFPIEAIPSAVMYEVKRAIANALQALESIEGKAFLTQHPDIIHRVPQYNFAYYQRKYGAKRIPANESPGTLRRSAEFHIQAGNKGIEAVWRAYYAQYVDEAGLMGAHPSTPGTTLNWIRSKELQHRVRVFIYEIMKRELKARLGRYNGLVRILSPTEA